MFFIAILRHRQFQHFPAGQAEIDAPDQPSRQPVRNGDRRRGYPGEPALDASAGAVECLAIRRAEVPVERICSFKRARIFDVDLVERHAVPRTGGYLHQTGVLLSGGRNSKRNARGGLQRPAERADVNVKGSAASTDFLRQPRGHLIRLKNAALRQRRILLSLETPERVPYGFPMPEKVDHAGYLSRAMIRAGGYPNFGASLCIRIRGSLFNRVRFSA
jgi:hypothetical protein